MNIRVYKHKHINTYVHIPVYMYTYPYISRAICPYTFANILFRLARVCLHIYINILIYIYIYVCWCIYIYVYNMQYTLPTSCLVWRMFVHIHMYIFLCIYTYSYHMWYTFANILSRLARFLSNSACNFSSFSARPAKTRCFVNLSHIC